MRLIVLAGASLAIGACAATVRSSDLRAELESIFETDQSLRLKLQDAALKPGPMSADTLKLVKQQHAIDETNLRRIEEIVKEHGWPDRRVLGDKAAGAAFLVIQHSDYPHQKQYLPLLRAAVAEGKAEPGDLALLQDRVLMAEGKKQLYGSQLQENGKGGWEFYPIEDERNVDERRKAMGLGSLAEYAKLFGIKYPAKP